MSGAPAAGIPIDFVRTGGVALERDSVRTTTDSDGQFAFDIGARGGGDGPVVGYIRVSPSDRPAFRVTDVELPSSNRRGEARTFGPWTTVPALPDAVDIYVRGAPPVTAASVGVEFRRTGGVEVEGLSNGVYSSVTDSKGRMPLFGNQLRPVDVGDVVGDLTVFMPAPIGTIVRRDVHVAATARFRPGLTVRRLGIGPSLEYHIAVNRRGRPEPVTGVQVQFHWTAGIDVNPLDWTSSTDATGRVAFPVRAQAAGVVTGDVKIIPPAPWKSFERTGLSFATFESDTARLYAVLEVGPGVGAFAVLRANGAPIKGVQVDFQHAGGVGVSPRTMSAVSNDSGYAYLTTASESEGEVTADLTVRPPAPYRTFVVRGVKLQARDGDAPATPVIIGPWDVARPPSNVRVVQP